ncbi:Cff1p [Sporobolomyces salmoneus]|uniref:Cff1p n=1 Tax=Sporobolomyces salmoneus TaxID=183962 RepID=UPI003170FA97
MSSQPYAYPTPNSVLKQTDRRKEQVASPYANRERRSLATQIYYLLDPKSPKGNLHLNKSTTYHLHHSGRSLYTLLRPTPSGRGKPEIKQVVMGENVEKGQVRQLVVEGGWWKCSEIPEEDLEEGEEERVGCLISEVVVPGFAWPDHAFLTEGGLWDILRGGRDDEFEEGGTMNGTRNYET